MIDHIGIIGSGITGLTVAKALIDRGYRPIVLDVGKTLDSDRRIIVDRLSQISRSNWAPEDEKQITFNPTLGSPFGPKKLAFGSDYIYGGNSNDASIEGWEQGPNPTFARGGYSTVWGASMLPTDDCDMTDWPIRRADLEPYYRKVLKDLPLSGREDYLNRNFPLYKSNPEPINIPPLAQAFLRTLNRSNLDKTRNDFLFGQARLAVRAVKDQMGNQCMYCGICLSGCVYGAIYSADQELLQLERAGLIEYRPNILVRSLEEKQDKVSVIFDSVDGQRKKAKFSRIFLAAGAVNSTRIVLESKQLYNREATMKTTQGFYIPILCLHSKPFNWPNVNTLPALFLEFKHKRISNHWIHVQITADHDLMMQKLNFDRIRNSFRDKILKQGFKRLLLAHGNLHSEHAGKYSLKLRPGSGDGRNTLVIKAKPSAISHRTAWHAATYMSLFGLKLRSVFLLPFLHISQSGQGQHFGGTLPMSARNNDELETDLLGRPTGWNRIHVVDSSIFPSIPGTTIALLAMANARRIADTAPLD
jgi:choline dehydrogenase-like flavoprotein